MRRVLFNGLFISLAAACGVTTMPAPHASDASSVADSGLDGGLGVAGDAGSPDAGTSDAGVSDAGATDAGRRAGVCSRRCVIDADCCPPGTQNCPGPFPTNYRCVETDGVRSCRGPSCASTADCLNTLPPGYECMAIGFGGACVTPCTSDAQCSPSPVVCVGVSNDGGRFCNRVLTPFRCTVGDGQCAGAGECAPSGDRCECTHDDDCADTRWTKDCLLR